MAPMSKRKRISTRRTTATKTEDSSATRRIITRSIYKKLINQEDHDHQKSCLKSVVVDDDDHDDDASTTNNFVDQQGCTTPKSEKHKIPEIKTCPPAPKKPRVSPCILQRRRPISFFAHPDLDKFFMFAMRDIKV